MSVLLHVLSNTFFTDITAHLTQQSRIVIGTSCNQVSRGRCFFRQKTEITCIMSLHKMPRLFRYLSSHNCKYITKPAEIQHLDDYENSIKIK